MRLRIAVIGLVLAAVSLGSTALTMGRARGAAWIGQSLELIVPVQLDPGSSASALCADADVFYGDSKQESSRVQVGAEPGPQPDSAQLRISSSALIDEPVVTVYLRAGCTSKATRRFVLLADYASESQAPASATPQRSAPVAEPAPVAALPDASTVAASSSTSAPATAAPAVNAPAKSAPLAAKSRPVAQIAKAPDAPKPAPKAAPKPPPPAVPPVVANKPAAAEKGRSRLKLDPLENLTERIKTLETTTTAVPLEEMVRDSQRIQQLQSDVKALLDQSAKNDATMLALRDRLEKSESERVPMLVVYGLIALILLCVAGMVVLWNRRGDPSAWRAGLQPSPTSAPEPSVAPTMSEELTQQMTPAPERAKSDFPTTRYVPVEAHHPEMDIDVDLVDMDDEAFDNMLKTQPPPPTQPAAFAVGAHEAQVFKDSGFAPSDFNTDSMFDLRQQADFFVKLNKTDEAIEALEKRIRANDKGSPLLYLDLLRIAFQQSLKTDYRQFRDEFEGLFNAKVPEFALFKNEGRGLESYPAVINHIAALWPSARVLDVLESCILKDPYEKTADPFDLEAFRELVLLHGIAHRLNQKDASSGVADGSGEHVDLVL